MLQAWQTLIWPAFVSSMQRAHTPSARNFALYVLLQVLQRGIAFLPFQGLMMRGVGRVLLASLQPLREASRRESHSPCQGAPQPTATFRPGSLRIAPPGPTS